MLSGFELYPRWVPLFGAQIENSNLFVFFFSFFPSSSYLYFPFLAIFENIGPQNSHFSLTPVKWLQYSAATFSKV